MTHATKTRTGTLDDIAPDSHVFSIIAMDQRNTLRRMFTAAGFDASDDDLRTAKADVARVLTPAASGLLSDPTYGVPAITGAGALAPSCGLLVAAEPSERRTYQGEPRTHRDPALDAQWVLDQGGDVLKFFVQLRADRPAPGPGEPDLVAEALAVCEEIIRDCRATGVPVVIENLVYVRPGEDLQGQAREDAIIESARALNDLDIDLLKLEYPGSPEGCRRLAVDPRPALGGPVRRRSFRPVHRHHPDRRRGRRSIRFHRRPLRVARSRQPHRSAAAGVPHLGGLAAAGAAHHGRRTVGPAVDPDNQPAQLKPQASGGHPARRWSWTRRIAVEPSPTAAATRFTDPCRTSPTAKTPGRLDSRNIGMRLSGHS